MLKIQVKTDFNDLSNFRNEWNNLVYKAPTNTIFQTFEWNYCWWNTFNGNNELFMIIVEGMGEVVGIAPLMIGKKGVYGNKRVVQFIGTGMSDYCDFIIRGNNSVISYKILEYLFQNKARWDQIKLAEIPERSTTGKVIEEFCRQYGLRTLLIRDSVCPSLVIINNEQDVRVISNKKSLLRRRKYFIKQGSYEVLHLKDSYEITEYLDAFFEQHISRWEKTATPSMFLEKDYRLFFEKLVKEMCVKKWIIFTVIKSKGVPIAFHFGFDYNNIILWYKPTYNISFSRYSSGQVLLKELLDYAIEREKDEFDFTVGNEPFKMRFSNSIRKNQSFCIYQNFSEYQIRRALNFMMRISSLLIKSVKVTHMSYSIQGNLQNTAIKK